MPRVVLIVLLLLGSLALVPFACVARSRALKSPSPRLHIVQDMDGQGKFKPQQPNPIFVDGRAMRRPPAGTVARGMLQLDDHLYRGFVDDDYAQELPRLTDLAELAGWSAAGASPAGSPAQAATDSARLPITRPAAR